MEAYTVTPLTAQVPTADYVKDCVDVEKFLGFCKQCPNYGKKWACPPLAQDPMEIWNAYSQLTLFARVLTPREGLTYQEFMDVFLKEKIDLSREVLELEQRCPGSRSMAASTCVACKVCTRAEGKPCRHPEQVRYSLEALGADVGKTMERYLHKPLQWIQPGQLPSYLVCVAALLTP